VTPFALTVPVACSSEEAPQPPPEETAQREETTVVEETTEMEAEEETSAGIGEEVDLDRFSVGVFSVRSEDTAYYYPGPDAAASSEGNPDGEYVIVD
jgi:hypothetical protein